MKRTYTREELHELVWSTPIVKLAEQLDISDKGLAKICLRHLVPVPPRGYWAKLEAGQNAKRTPLRTVNNSALHAVHIGSRPMAPQSDYLLEVLASAKVDIERENQIPNLELPHAVVVSRSKEIQSSLPANREHGEVNAFIAELRKVTPDRDGFVYLKYIKVAPADINRVRAILSSLAKELQQHNFGLRLTTNRLGFSKESSTVDFEITAPRKRVVAKTAYGWESFDYEHTGRLIFRIFGRADGTRKSWKDTDSRKVEDSLAQIVEGFRINFVVEREDNEKQRIETARRAHMAHRRELASQREKREDDRLVFLKWIADARREADDLRATIATVPQSGEMPPDYQRMLKWAQNRLMELEHQTSVDRIQVALMDRQLYSSPDHLLDTEGDPPPKVNYWDI